MLVVGGGGGRKEKATFVGVRNQGLPWQKSRGFSRARDPLYRETGRRGSAMAQTNYTARMEFKNLTTPDIDTRTHVSIEKAHESL